MSRLHFCLKINYVAELGAEMIQRFQKIRSTNLQHLCQNFLCCMSCCAFWMESSVTSFPVKTYSAVAYPCSSEEKVITGAVKHQLWSRYKWHCCQVLSSLSSAIQRATYSCCDVFGNVLALILFVIFFLVNWLDQLNYKSLWRDLNAL